MAFLTGELVNFQIRQRLSVCVALFVTTALVGCGEELSCSAPETRQLIDQLTNQEAKKSGIFEPGQPLVTLAVSLADIITTEKKTSKTSCKAKLTMTFTLKGPPEQVRNSDLSITYNVERTDDGRLSVTVHGL